MENIIMINKNEPPRYIKINREIVCSPAAKSNAKDFYDLFVEPYIKNNVITIDFGSISHKDVIKFIEAINEISKNSKNIIFRRKEVKE